MKIQQAMRGQGGRIRRKSWTEIEYVFWDEDTKGWKKEDGFTVSLEPKDLGAEDWEIYKVKQTPVVQYLECPHCEGKIRVGYPE